MKLQNILFILLILSLALYSCSKPNEKNNDHIPSDMNILFLHHSTGNYIWNGTKRTFLIKVVDRISNSLAKKLTKDPQLPVFMDQYNQQNNTNYKLTKMAFPKKSPYGWNNYPYDYYNIWVKNAGNKPYMEEPTLEMLTRNYQVIIFKHCYPASNIQADGDSADINSDVKTLANYKLQYEAIKKKLHQFPNTKFILFTSAVQVKYYLPEDEAFRANQFHDWVVNEWNEEGDNIHLWDLYTLQTEGSLYFKDNYALTAHNSHPGGNFSIKASKLLFKRIIDVVENNGAKTKLTGESL